MYSPVNAREAYRLKEIITDVPLIEPIHIEIPDYDLTFRAYYVSESAWENANQHACEIDFLNEQEEGDVLHIAGRDYNTYFYIGPWSYKTRIEDVHISLYSSAFSSRFAQLEMSQFVMDDNFIYVIKNITKIAGAGAITRLYSGLGRNRARKLDRQGILIRKTGFDLLDFEGDQWLVIYRISTRSLFDKNKAPNILREFFKHFLFYAFMVECIRNQGS